jgi:hypothetical protein
MKYRTILTISALAFITACGGGSSDTSVASDTDASNNAVYVGVETQAEFTVGNTQEIVSRMNGVISPVGNLSIASLSGSTSSKSFTKSIQGLLINTKNAIESNFESLSLDQDSNSYETAASSIFETITESGSVGGTLSIEGTNDSNNEGTSGTFSVTMTLKDFNDGDLVANGILTAVGDWSDDGIFVIDAMTIDIDNLSLAIPDSSEVLSFNGNMVFTKGGTNSFDNLTFNFTVTDGSMFLKIVDYEIETYAENYYAIKGKVYHSDYGYIEIEQVGGSYISYTDGSPTSGQSRVISSNGTSIVTYTENGYEVTIDDGDLISYTW